MKIPSFGKLGPLIQMGKTAFVARRPELLFGSSIITTITAVVLAGRGGYQAGQRVLEAEHPHTDLNSPENPLNLKDKVALTWSCYIPAAAGTVAALGSTTALHLVHVQEKKILAQAAMLAAQEGKTLIEELKPLVSDDEDDFESEADEEGVVRRVNSSGEIEELYLVRDEWTGRDIWSNTARIADAVNQANNVIVGSDDLDLNTFYSYAGFEEIPTGFDFGWSGVLVDVAWSTTLRDDGRPVKVFRFRSTPEKDYGNRK